ncbi:F-box only protein 3-like isoform X2 [Babylonia areolata]|uniref:F-box only protein 3-like isoform X2 n=1 Tax=Babylonia areolata TaxID=304850 RepID=UPI003FCF3FFC
MASCNDANKASFVGFPAEILLHILSKLDFRSLVRLGRTCKKLWEISCDDSLWKQQCKTEYLLTEKDADTKSWYHLFRWYHNRIGRYHCPSEYRTMRRLWNRLEKYLRKNDPQILESLRGPCDISEILIAEEKLKCRFPADLRSSLLIHNGQQMTSTTGLLGCVTMTSDYSSEGLVDAASMARESGRLWDDLPGCVPITCNTFDDDSDPRQYLAVKDEAGFTVGEVFSPVMHSGTVPVTNTDIFITGTSYKEWFEDLVIKLETNAFPRIDNRIHRFEHDPDCVARSYDCFTVKVSTCFQPEYSTINPCHFLHVYRITMSMDESAPPSLSCQLETRHWIITDMDGSEERVDGEGVVGEFPIMKPGVSCAWISCVQFSTTYGNMTGSFTMKNLQSGEKMEIVCPTFHLKCLPYKLFSERREIILRRKKNL